MQIVEDSKGKNWSSKMIFIACIRAEKPLLPILVPLFIISVLSKFFFDLPAKLSTFTDFLVFLPFIGPTGGAMAMIIFRTLPNRWSFTEKGILIRGREFKTIKWDKVTDWSIFPVNGLEGYNVLQLNYNAARKSESCVVINPTYSLEKINKWLTRHCTRPEETR